MRVSCRDPATYGQYPGSRDGLGRGEELWLVNTRFSCLCTLDQSPVSSRGGGRPLSQRLAPKDRCHLNGLAIVDGRPPFATALGADRWTGRLASDKARGGVLIDVATGETIARGRSMPHSPRFMAGGYGSASRAVDASALSTRAASLRARGRTPGFTRGLDFTGGLAFVGLSQVRESRLQRRGDHRATRGRTSLRYVCGRYPAVSQSPFCGSKKGCRRSSRSRFEPEATPI